MWAGEDDLHIYSSADKNLFWLLLEDMEVKMSEPYLTSDFQS